MGDNPTVCRLCGAEWPDRVDTVAAENDSLIAENKALREALEGLKRVMDDCRSDESANGEPNDTNNVAGAYVFGDVMSEALESARVALNKGSAEG